MLKRLELIDSLRVGHPVIDAEHGELIDKANGLIDALEAGERDTFLAGLPAFAHRIAEHFDTEIAILREIGFPGADEHEEFHRHSLQDVEKLKQLFETTDDRQMTPEWAHAKITGLLIHDFVREDLEFKSFLAETYRNADKD
jgi:hemerythrin-like metal-binding protein